MLRLSFKYKIIIHKLSSKEYNLRIVSAFAVKNNTIQKKNLYFAFILK